MSPRVALLALLLIGASPVAGAFNIRVLPSCIEPFTDGSGFIASFGYESLEPSLVQVLIGPDNTMAPGPEDRNQPTVFLPGYFERAFRIRFSTAPGSGTLTWTFLGQTVTASSNTRRCDSPAPRPRPTGLIERISGADQSSRVGTLFPQPIVVQASFAGRPIANAVLLFIAPPSGASGVLQPANGLIETDANGRASIRVTAGATAGAWQLTVQLGSATTPTAPTRITIPLTNLP